MSANRPSRLRETQILRALLVYAGAAWAVLEATDFFITRMGLPEWVFRAALLLLGIGLTVLLTTAWVQWAWAVQKRDEAQPTSPWRINLRELLDSLAHGRLPRLNWGRWALGGLVAFSLLFGFAGLYVLITQRGRVAPVAPELAADVGPAIAVLPFRVVGPDSLLWREGMVDLLYNDLDGVAGLRAIDPRTILSRWRVEMGVGNQASDAEQLLRIARDAGATYALLGSMVGSASVVRITAEVHDLRDGTLQRAQVEGSPDSVLALVDRLGLEILRTGLLPRSETLSDLDLSHITTSLPALRAYLDGERKYRRSRFREAIGDYTRAVEADSTFAVAYYRISQAYGWVEPFSPRSVEYSNRAEELADRLPERLQLLLRGRAGLESFRTWGIDALEEFTARYPDDVEGWLMLGDVYYHVGDRALYPRDRALRAFERALELDPGFGPAYIHLIDDALLRQDSAAARELIARHRAIDPDSPHARGLALVYALVWGDRESRAQAHAALDTASADALVAASSRFHWSGNFYWQQAIAVANALLDERNPPAAQRFGQTGLVRAYLGQGQVRRAREALAGAAARLGSDPEGVYAAQLDLLWFLSGAGDLEAARRADAVLAAQPFPSGRFYRGAFAAYGERWEDAVAEIEALESGAREREAQGDSLAASDTRALAEALRGYLALRREDFAAARAHIEAALPALGDLMVHSLLQFELGSLLLEQGELEQAKRYFESLEFYNQFEGSIIHTTPSEYYLGVIHEALGDIEQAKLHYARVVRWWEHADPEFSLLWVRAQEALERLTQESTS